MGRTYIHQLNEWPHFQCNLLALGGALSEADFNRGKVIGIIKGLGIIEADHATLEALTDEVKNTSEIEGEHLTTESIRSSVGRRLGLDVGGLQPEDQRVAGIVDVVLDATRNFEQPLTIKRLFSWHAALFPTGYSGLQKIDVARWRSDKDGPMQVVSGRLDKPTVHFEAVPAERIGSEMKGFVNWFEKSNSDPPLIKAMIAHLWFETIHPFDDGNGRIGRALLDMSLARADNQGLRCYSISAQIQKEKATYYNQLERAQTGRLDITEYLGWFISCYNRALLHAEKQITQVQRRSKLWRQWGELGLSERQLTALRKIVDAGNDEVSTKVWAKLTKVSTDTGLRDLQSLVEKGVFRQEGAGRGAKYVLVSLSG